ncbi:MAG: hypothetical protein ACKO46_03900 [Alphaproteobacteria bacterium]
MFNISLLKSFIAGFVSSSTLTFVKLRKHSFTEAKIALEKDFLAITRDKNIANNKLKNNNDRI